MNAKGRKIFVSLTGGAEFDEPITAITHRQLAAFYIQQSAGMLVAGAGWIGKKIPINIRHQTP
jgi:hypothetical protein